MKNVVKKLVRGEQGAALILVLVVLLVGGLIAGGLLQHMGAGLLSGEVYARRTAELYAADAGVEDAIWKIQHGETPLCPKIPHWSYTIPDTNGKSIEVSIDYLGEGTYRITSVAATADGGNTAALVGSTTVESYVSASFLNFSSLLDNAIVSNSTITIQPGNVVDGDVWLPDADDLVNRGTVVGDVRDSDDVTVTWPTYEQLSGYYWEDVEAHLCPYSSIDIKDRKTIGPCYTEGSLAVDNTGDPETLVLEGTVYVRGNLEFQQSGQSKYYTIDLNGNTIFVEGYVTFASDHIAVSGSGCIIAVGNINFQPSIASEEDEFVLVLSIAGEMEFHPSGSFTGCVAGDVNVQLQPGNSISWINPQGKGLNFPMGSDDPNELPPVSGLKIESWEIDQQ